MKNKSNIKIYKGVLALNKSAVNKTIFHYV
jgi:hypothetical protein